MRRFQSVIQRYVLLLLLAALVALAVGLLVYIASTAGTQREDTQLISTSLLVTARPPAETPLAPFAQVDPAIIPYLEHGQPEYGIVALEVLQPNIPPVGAYLPVSGNTQFELPEPTLTAQPNPTPVYVTLPPRPTRTPLPPPTATNELVATVLAFATNAPLTAIAYTGAECAPAGLPVEGFILTQRFHAYHSGIDLAVPLSTPVYATHSGTVIWADWNVFGYGNLVIVQSGHFITYYAHLTSFNVKNGDLVTKGTLVAFSGSTGHSSGPHVHYETRIDDVPVDPQTFEARGYYSC